MPERHDYALKVDEQVAKFLESDNRLTFFIVTASVACLGFTLKFASDAELLADPSVLVVSELAFGAVLALLASAMAIRSLLASIQSSRFHLGARYQGKSYDQLPEEKKEEWDAANRTWNRSRTSALWLLVASVAAQAVFLFVSLLPREEVRAMSHHYGEDSTFVSSEEEQYRIRLLNKVSGKEIVVIVPRQGALEDATAELDSQTAHEFAMNLAHWVRDELE